MLPVTIDHAIRYILSIIFFVHILPDFYNTGNLTSTHSRWKYIVYLLNPRISVLPLISEEIRLLNLMTKR